MSQVLQAIAVLLPVAYFAAALLFAMAFGGEHAPQVYGLRRWVLRGTIGLHALYVLLHARAAGAFPVTDTWMMLSTIVLMTALLFAGISWRQPQSSVGAWVLGLCALLQLAASALGPLGPRAPHPVDSFRILHVTTSVLAAAALLLSGVYGFLHILLYRQMRRRHFGPLFRQLPNLELLSRLTRRAALAGFLFLTVGLNLGIIVGHTQRPGSFDYSDPHVLLTLALWVHFGLIAFSRSIRGLTARRASFAATAGLVTLLLLIVLTLLPSVTSHALR